MAALKREGGEGEGEGEGGGGGGATHRTTVSVVTLASTAFPKASVRKVSAHTTKREPTKWGWSGPKPRPSMAS